MEDALRRQLLEETKKALASDDWNAVERLWQLWIQQGEAEAEYQLAYHYFWHTPCEDDATCDQMLQLLRTAAAKDHPDAIWLLATREIDDPETNPEFERRLLCAGQLGSVPACRALGVMYATGDWSGPQNLAEASRWYRLAAANGDADSQYDLGFMLLMGEGEPKKLQEGLMWLEAAGRQEHYSAFHLLVDCYENGFCGAPLDAAKAELWRCRLEDYQRLHPPAPSRSYSINGTAEPSSLNCLLEIKGVTGLAVWSGNSQFSLSYDPDLVTPEQLDEQIRAAGLSVTPAWFTHLAPQAEHIE